MPTVDLTRIGSNIGALYSLQSLLDINNKLAAAQSKLSTGKRINSAADDPAGLVIATKMNARSQGLKVAMDNISDAKNMMSVAEAGLSKITDILTTMRNKATQAASDTLGSTERITIQTQLSQFAQQIDDIVNQTKWNGVQLLGGALSKVFQTGVEEGESTSWDLNVKHDPTSLAVSSVAAQGANTTVNIGGALNPFTTNSTIYNGLTELSTGTYNLVLKNSAASATTGKIANAVSSIALGATDTATYTIYANNNAATGSQLSNTSHTLTSIALNTSTSALSYTIDGTISGSVSLTGLNNSGTTAIAAGSYILKGGAGDGDYGISIAFGAGNITSFTGGYTFDYVKKNMAQMQLQSADGTALAVDADGVNGTAGTTTTFYATAGNSYDTGRGLVVNAGAIAALNTNQNSATKGAVTYTRASNYSVDVSTAAKAGAYMTTVTTAMDLVNQSMADLGSLMARMDIKSATASAAQINVESAYNRIMNANMAEEQVNASKYQVLQQTAVAMLAQSNQAPQAILSLFK